MEKIQLTTIRPALILNSFARWQALIGIILMFSWKSEKKHRSLKFYQYNMYIELKFYQYIELKWKMICMPLPTMYHLPFLSTIHQSIVGRGLYCRIEGVYIDKTFWRLKFEFIDFLFNLIKPNNWWHASIWIENNAWIIQVFLPWVIL